MSSAFAISVSKAIGREVHKYQQTVKKYNLLDANELLLQELTANRIVLISHTTCPACKRAKRLLKRILPKGTTINVVDVDLSKFEKELRDVLQQISGNRQVPQIYVDTKYIGGEREIDANDGIKILQKFVEKGVVRVYEYANEIENIYPEETKGDQELNKDGVQGEVDAAIQ